MARLTNGKPVTPEQLVSLFTELAGELTDRLLDNESWGPSGLVPGQYAFDLIADEVIIDALHSRGLRTLSEESGITGPTSDLTVVVDPVDGSTNASLGLPWFATSLCAVDDHGPIAAGVFNLATGDSWRAIRGQGYEWDRGLGAAVSPRRVTERSTCTELTAAILAFSGLPPTHGGWRQYRTYGASALDLCGVAVGAFDGFVDVNSAHGVWDYLGAMLVCQEAGVEFDEIHGRELVVLDHGVRRGPVAAATPELMASLRDMISGWQLTP